MPISDMIHRDDERHRHVDLVRLLRELGSTTAIEAADEIMRLRSRVLELEAELAGNQPAE